MSCCLTNRGGAAVNLNINYLLVFCYLNKLQNAFIQ